MKRKSVGFTLIELLVVIAIIAILAAILFPIFATAKMNANTTKCLSSIKQVGSAMTMYADSHDGRLPPYSIGLGTKRLLWSYFIASCLRSDRIYRCSALPPKENRTNAYDAKGTARVFGYGVPYPHLFSPESSTKLGAIPRPMRTMLMCDSYAVGMDPWTRRPMETGYPVVYCRGCGDWHYQDERPDGNVAGRHGGRSDTTPYGKTSVLYCDMHAKALPKEVVIKKYSSVAESENDDMWAHFDNIQH